MNKFPIIALAMVVILVSCSNGGDPNNSREGKSVNISIKLKNKGVFNRSVDEQTTDEDAVINDLIVFLVRNDGNFDISPLYFTGSELIDGISVPEIQASTLATKVYIVCNTGPLTTGPFRGAFNLDDVQEVAVALDDNPNDASDCVSGNVWMAGNSALETGGTVDGVVTRLATVSLQFLPAKIYVIVNNQMSNYSAAGNTLLDGVAVVNGGAWTNFVDIAGNYKPRREEITTIGNVPFFYNGIPIDPANWTDQPAPVGGFTDYAIRSFYNFSPPELFPMTSTGVITPAADQGFYVFPLITNNKTYVTIYGRFAIGGAEASPNPTPFFWSLAFGGFDGVASDIQSGQKYVVTITLLGDANIGGGGTTDPTEELINAVVNISVLPAEWDPVFIEKIIN